MRRLKGTTACYSHNASSECGSDNGHHGAQSQGQEGGHEMRSSQCADRGRGAGSRRFLNAASHDSCSDPETAGGRENLGEDYFFFSKEVRAVIQNHFVELQILIFY